MEVVVKGEKWENTWCVSFSSFFLNLHYVFDTHEPYPLQSNLKLPCQNFPPQCSDLVKYIINITLF